MLDVGLTMTGMTDGVVPNLGRPFHRRITCRRVIGRNDGNQAVSPGKLGIHPERHVAARPNLPVIDRNLMPGILERPGDPMRLFAIGRVETDEEFLSHRSRITGAGLADFRFLLEFCFLALVDDRTEF